MVFNGLQEPANWEQLNDAEKREVGALVDQIYQDGKNLESGKHFGHGQNNLKKPILFLGRINGRILALGCMSIGGTFPRVARIHEVVVDGSIRTSSTEREIFFRLTSWAGAYLHVDLITLWDLHCLVSHNILAEAMFRRRSPLDHLWKRVVPGEENK